MTEIQKQPLHLEIFIKQNFWLLLIGLASVARDAFEAYPPSYYFSIFVTHSAVMLLLLIRFVPGAFGRDVIGITLFDFLFQLTCLFAYNVPVLKGLAGIMSPYVKLVNYILFGIYLMRVIWSFKNPQGTAFVRWPKFDLLRLIFPDTSRPDERPSKGQAMWGYVSILVAAPIIGYVLLANNITFFKSFAYLAPAMVGWLWIKEHRKHQTLICDDQAQAQLELAAKNTELAALRKKMATLKQEMATKDTENAALQQEIAALKQENADQKEEIEVIRHTLDEALKIDEGELLLLRTIDKIDRKRRIGVIELIFKVAEAFPKGLRLVKPES